MKYTAIEHRCWPRLALLLACLPLGPAAWASSELKMTLNATTIELCTLNGTDLAMDLPNAVLGVAASTESAPVTVNCSGPAKVSLSYQWENSTAVPGDPASVTFASGSKLTTAAGLDGDYTGLPHDFTAKVGDNPFKVRLTYTGAKSGKEVMTGTLKVSWA